MNLEDFLRFARSLIPFRIRKLDKEFMRFLVLLKENEKKTYEEIRHYQFQKLKEQVEKAYHHTKFYKKKYQDHGFNPEDLNDWSDIIQIPTLTRDELRKNSKGMILNTYKGKIYHGFTSGTTDHPVELFFDKKANSREWASICYQWARVGFAPTDGRVEFRGFIEENVNYIFIPDYRVLRINIIKMSENNIESIIKKIKSKGYQFLHGYPSAIYKFAKILKKKKIIINPKAILLASEVLYDWQMDLIDEVFPNSKKIIHYGQAEKVALGAWDGDKKYHFIPSYGLLEIDKNNNEMIATSFINEIMPIIRYRLTDSIEGIQEKPSATEKTLFPIIDKIHGRIEDYTYNTNGDLIPPAIVTFPFKKLKQVSACKIIQHTLNDFEIIFEAIENENTKKEVNYVVNNLKKIFGVNANMTIRYVEKIPVNKSGKFRWIECNINKNK